ncbi:Phosphate transport system permease protein PstC [compost metagenome]|jgi:phosphate transport system permease protein|uniref:Phosphate transport system permease protein n=1 Tax=Paenibacillus rhizolycopersici TaxID=2780073 RepID=A0ABS2H7J2_9BACL|nr:MULTISPECIES: phosphate ABC transporter permease subunit PstC [Paenibacillus]MBM6997392.1 phosphate ABC transporter permease subunit PstC [Paenibacillus rhizolycopersici]MUG85204.1 phosphate ABC transporter permease subunit PstC [Paenibacillus timonensis]GIP47079.1 phosphate transport system permease protein [Paenibacillus sp. J53TS2]
MAQSGGRKKIQPHIVEEWTGKIYASFCIVLLVVTIFSMVYYVATKGLSTFFQDGIAFREIFGSTNWKPDGEPPVFGALPFILGSFGTSILAALIAAPLGICAALFMVEIMPKFGKKYLQPVIELLAGIPSVVYGFVGLSVIVPFYRDIFPGQGLGILAGATVLSIMILPTITSIATDALAALPPGLKEGSYALGATRWQTLYRTVLPTTMPALLTGVVLGMARAFGEALAVQMVIGNAPHIPRSLFESTSTLTSVITLSMGNTVMGSTQNNVLWTLALILMLMTFIFVFIVRWLERRAKR